MLEQPRGHFPEFWPRKTRAFLSPLSVAFCYIRTEFSLSLLRRSVFSTGGSLGWKGQGLPNMPFVKCPSVFTEVLYQAPPFSPPRCPKNAQE